MAIAAHRPDSIRCLIDRSGYLKIIVRPVVGASGETLHPPPILNNHRIFWWIATDLALDFIGRSLLRLG